MKTFHLVCAVLLSLTGFAFLCAAWGADHGNTHYMVCGMMASSCSLAFFGFYHAAVWKEKYLNLLGDKREMSIEDWYEKRKKARSNSGMTIVTTLAILVIMTSCSAGPPTGDLMSVGDLGTYTIYTGKTGDKVMCNDIYHVCWVVDKNGDVKLISK